MRRPSDKQIKASLQTVLILPFVTLIALASGLVGYISFLNGQNAVNKVAHQLRDEVTTHIKGHLKTFLETPHHINQTNANAISLGWLDYTDPQAMESRFWEQIQMFPSVNSVYFGNPQGGLVNAGREGPVEFVIFTENFTSGTFKKYATDHQGKHTDLLSTVPNFDARKRPWYAGAVQKGDATWSDAYVLFTRQDMAFAASRPVYDTNHNLLGVVSVDIFSGQITSFLKSLNFGKTGQGFIIDRSGYLIASSTDEKPFTIPANSDPIRLKANQSSIPLIHDAAQFLETQFSDYKKITTQQQFEFTAHRQRQFLQITPLQDQYGIDWLIIVVIPEADFMAQIDANNRTTAFLVITALIITVALGIFTAKRITQPVLRLKASSQAMAQGDWQHADLANNHSSMDWIEEISDLTSSFRHMGEQLKHSLESLTSEIHERQQTELALRKSEENLELALKGGDLGTWDWNIQTGEAVFNHRWVEMLGYTLDEIPPRYSAWKNLIHPDDLTSVTQALNSHLKGETPIYHTEYRLHTKDHQWCWVLSTGKVLVRDAQGQPLRASGIHQDITERKQTEQALHESKQRLEKALVELEEAQEKMVQQERLAAVGQMAAGIAHDFNNILTSISLYTQMMLQSAARNPQDALSPKNRERIEVISRQTSRAAELVQQILDFGRKAVLTPRPLQVDAMLKEMSDLLERTLPENIELTLNTIYSNRLSAAPGEFTIHADPTRFQQVIMNLVMNARDAMPQGGQLHITLTRTNDQEIMCSDCGRVAVNSWVTIRITDTGAGIPPEVLPHIFEPFYTTKSPPSSGLGLGQVFGIIKQHQGHIYVETEVGNGTTFYIHFPAQPLEQIPVPTSPAPAFTSVSGATILVVEDNPTIRIALTDSLQVLGYQVLTAANGQEALEMCAKYGCAAPDNTSPPHQGIDLVLSDWVMPVMGGLEMVQALIERQLMVKILMLTGHTLTEEARAIPYPGIVGWLIKPPTLEQLAIAVAQALST